MTASDVLEALNQPSLISVTGLATLAVLPTVEHAMISSAIPFAAIKILNLAAYALAYMAAQQPGRLDGRQQQQQQRGDASSLSKQGLALQARAESRRNRSLFVPRGYAFLIWAPIFLGEFIACIYTVFLKESAKVVPVLKQTSAGFLAAQIFQTLWTASFRPKYSSPNGLIYISSLMLSGISYSLSRSHKAFAVSASKGLYSNLEYVLLFLPLSLHFAWTAAASLVNLNGNVCFSEKASEHLVAATGHASTCVATVLGVVITLTRQAPVVGGVIAWALAAVAVEMNGRLHSKGEQSNKKNKDAPDVGVYGARLQKWLSTAGALLSGVAAVIVSLKLKIAD